MKEEYATPETIVYDVKIESSLLNGSPENMDLGGEYNI